MNKVLRWSIVGMMLAAVLAVVPSIQAKEVKTEDELIADMSSSIEKDVVRSMLEWEKRFPTSTKALPVLKKSLVDPRSAVRRKAARVLGSLHAEVSRDDLKAIAAMTKSPDKLEAQDALKALAGLQSKPVIADIIEALKYPNDNVKRDACRTLAVVGDKSAIKDIEPLLQYPDAKVQKDAMDAIAALKMK